MNPTPSPERPEVWDSESMGQEAFWCNAWSGGYRCTRHFAHNGPHIAHNFRGQHREVYRWPKEVATRTPAPEAVAGELGELGDKTCDGKCCERWASLSDGSSCPCPICHPPTPPADKDAEIMEGYGVAVLAQHEAVRRMEQAESDLTTARATIAERDKQIMMDTECIERIRNHGIALELQVAERDKRIADLEWWSEHGRTVNRKSPDRWIVTFNHPAGQQYFLRTEGRTFEEAISNAALAHASEGMKGDK